MVLATREIISRADVSRVSEPIRPRKYLAPAIWAALSDQKSGNSSSRSSVCPLIPRTRTETFFHPTASKGCMPDLVKSRLSGIFFARAPPCFFVASIVAGINIREKKFSLFRFRQRNPEKFSASLQTGGTLARFYRLARVLLPGAKHVLPP